MVLLSGAHDRPGWRGERFQEELNDLVVMDVVVVLNFNFDIDLDFDLDLDLDPPTHVTGSAARISKTSLSCASRSAASTSAGASPRAKRKPR